MKASLAALMRKVPGSVTKDWPDGEPFVEAMRHGTMSLEVFAPRGRDTQQPHEQDELYIVIAGEADFIHEGKRERARSGDVLFVPANAKHHFEAMSGDFVTWVVFWGPKGGER